MDKNFHYHGTYTAARQAGYSAADSAAIARAAQYVDECEGVTVQGTPTLFLQNLLDALPFCTEALRTLLKIWPVYHFLPGDPETIRPYVNSQLTESSSPYLRSACQLICGTESRLVQEIVEGAKAFCDAHQEDRAQCLQRVGITMHVLADTFAHQYFAGIPLAQVNEVDSVREAELNSDLVQKNYKPLSYSPALSSGSFGYLGHGRIGHLPDQPGKVFLYRAAWRSQTRDPWIFRCNPLEFYCAYLQMTEAMEYIRGTRALFSNLLDRGLMLDRRGTCWPETQRFLWALSQAGTDRDLPERWYPVTGVERCTQPYEPYDAEQDEALIKSFTAAAEDHRQLVLDKSPALRNCLALL